MVLPIFPVLQTLLLLLPAAYLRPQLGLLHTLPFDRFHSEARYWISLAIISTSTLLFKKLIETTVSMVDNENLNDARQHRIEQSLLNVSQIIEIN